MTPEPRWCQTTTAEKRMGRMNARGMLVAVNRTAGEWGGDSVAATAILDRLLHHRRAVTIRG